MSNGLGDHFRSRGTSLRRHLVPEPRHAMFVVTTTSLMTVGCDEMNQPGRVCEPNGRRSDPPVYNGGL